MNGAPTAAATPFFVVGAQRSGTTMLRLMLNRHSRLHVPFESRFIPEFVGHPLASNHRASPDDIRALLDAISSDEFVRKGQLVPDPDQVLASEPKTYAQLVDSIFTVHARMHGKGRWGDKTPTYVLEMDALRRLFPDCKFIHLVRDGRDVVCSLQGVSWGTPDLLRAAQDWRWKVTLGRKMGAMVPHHYLEVSYESLVTEPERDLKLICDFLDEQYEPSMLDYPRDAARNMPESSLQWHGASIQAPDLRKVGAWRTRLNQADLRVFEDVAGDALDMFGYERLNGPRTLRSRLRFAQYALLGHA